MEKSLKFSRIWLVNIFFLDLDSCSIIMFLCSLQVCINMQHIIYRFTIHFIKYLLYKEINVNCCRFLVKQIFAWKYTESTGCPVKMLNTSKDLIALYSTQGFSQTKIFTIFSTFFLFVFLDAHLALCI